MNSQVYCIYVVFAAEADKSNASSVCIHVLLISHQSKYIVVFITVVSQ